MVQFVGFSDVRFQIERFRGLGVFRVQDCRFHVFMGLEILGLGDLVATMGSLRDDRE